MKDLLDKISSYNIFNYLFPGIVFAAIASKFTTYNFLREDLLVGGFAYYFLGLVISRIGSLVVEPLLKKTGIITFSSYENFVRAAKDDAKLEVLSETNNMYRTLVALPLCVGGVCLYDKTEKLFHLSELVTLSVVGVGLLGLFILSYRKQTAYIAKRVLINSK